MIVHREAARAYAVRSSRSSESGPEPGCDDQGLATVIEREALRPALGGLDAGERAVIVLHYYLDLSVDDVARTLGMPSGTVKVKLARTRAKLRDAIV